MANGILKQPTAIAREATVGQEYPTQIQAPSNHLAGIGFGVGHGRECMHESRTSLQTVGYTGMSKEQGTRRVGLTRVASCH